jgi:hypothetical protein
VPAGYGTLTAHPTGAQRCECVPVVLSMVVPNPEEQHRVNDDSIRLAIAEAKRFISRAEEALADRYDYHNAGHHSTGRNSGKASGACRRASPDLTRTLAEMRKP